MIYPKKLLAVLPLRRQKAQCFGLFPIAAAWAAEGWQTYLCKLHGAGLVHDVNAAPPACVGLLGREAEAACPCPIHPPEGAVGCGGVGYSVVRAAGRPAGKFCREQLPLALLGQIPAVILGAVHKVAGDPPGRLASVFRGLGRRAMARPVK